MARSILELPDIFFHVRPFHYPLAASASSNVSSLYGPGTTLCWLLTVASCFCSWCLDPQKRRSGAIDADFIATLTFPVVAAGHLIAQTNALPKPTDEATTGPNSLENLPRSLAIEASLNVTETFTGLSVLMLVIAAYSRCLYRSVLLASVGFFCVAAETYLYLSVNTRAVNRMDLGRLFLVSFPKLLVALDILLLAVLPIGLFVVLVIIVHSNVKIDVGRDQMPSTQTRRQRSLPVCLASKSANFAFMVAVGSWLVASLFPITSNAVNWSQSLSDPSFPLFRALRRFFGNMVPRTAMSIWELDQAVAVLAGSTVLAFSVYNAVAPRYRRWRARVRSRWASEEHEMARLRRIREHGA